MINKLVVDGQNITLNESTVLPFTYTFSTAGVHNVKVGLDNTNEICAYAFKDCEELTNVISIPERITMIKRNAFENCTHLEKFNVPSSIEYVGPNVFDGCIALKELKFNTDNPPRFLSNLDSNTTCYIPDGSKFIKVEDNSELVKDGSIQYYEKNILDGYEEVDFEALDDAGEYYYDNWTSVHDHYNTVEERFRVKATQIEFLDEGVQTTNFGEVNAGDEGDIFSHHLIPDNCTNSNVYIYSNNENILQVDQSGHFTTNSRLHGNANVNIIICTEPDYYGTYAFTSLRVRVKATNLDELPKIEMNMSFPENYHIDIDEAVIGDVIEFIEPTITGDQYLKNVTFEYESSNPSVADFENGKLKVISNGTTSIIAKYLGDEDHEPCQTSFEVHISALGKRTIELSFDEENVDVELFAGDELPIQDVTPSGLEITYSYEHDGVIDSNNKVLKSGIVTVMATFEGDENTYPATASYTINVIANKHNVEISFEESEVNLLRYIGDMIDIQEAQVNPDVELTYSFTHDNVIDGENKVLKSGDIIVTATFAGNYLYNAASASYTLHIVTTKDDVELSFEQPNINLTLNKGASEELMNITEIQLATCSLENAEITYTYSDPDQVISMVNDYAFANNSGVITITATYAGDETHNSATASYTLTVTVSVLEVEGIYETDENGNVQLIELDPDNIEAHFTPSETGEIQIIEPDPDSIMESEYQSNSSGDIQLINPEGLGELIYSEYESDEEGNTQILNPEEIEEQLFGEYDSDEEGDAQIINSNNG